MKIGIIVAMDKELQQLQHLFTDGNVIVQKCGMGKVNAALGALEMIDRHKPDVIISSGCAGGNGDDIQVQDVVVSTELAYHDVYCGEAIGHSDYGQVQGLPPRFQGDPMLLEKALRIQTSNISIHPGLIVTGDWFVDTMERSSTPFGQRLAQTCYLRHVPFISFRVISDIPLRDTDASQYHDFWNTVAENSFQVTKSFVEQLI